MHAISPVQQASLWNMEKLTFSRYKYCIILILSGTWWPEHCCVSCGFTGIISHPSLWSACGSTYYYNKKYVWKIIQFLTNFCDLIKYIMKYKCIWVTEKLQLALSYTWQLMRWTQHFYLNVTINHYWVFVITSDCDPMWILVKWWGRNMS